MGLSTTKTVLNGVTATTVSAPFYVGDVERAVLSFRRAGHASGSCIFTIQASIDGSTDGGEFVDKVNLISNDVNNHVQTLERQNSVELTENDHLLFALDLEHFLYEYIQVKVVENGVGTSTVKLITEC